MRGVLSLAPHGLRATCQGLVAALCEFVACVQILGSYISEGWGVAKSLILRLKRFVNENKPTLHTDKVLKCAVLLGNSVIKELIG